MSAPLAPSRPGRLAVVVLFGVFVLGALLRAVFLIWHPPFDTDLYDYDVVAPMRDAWFAMHLFVAVPGWLLLFPAFGMLVVLLCARGRVAPVLALLGALVSSAGAILFASGLAAEGAAWRWATDPAVVDPAGGAELLRGFEAVPFTTDIILTGNVLIPLGLLASIVALFVARALPLWLPIATLVLLVATAALPPLPIVSAVLTVLQTIALIAVGAFALRRPAAE